MFCPSMSDEELSFPNAERLFKEAFADPDPVPPLLKLLKEHPTYGTVRDLVVLYTEEVEGDPSRGQYLASCLARMCDSSDAPTFQTYTLWELVSQELADQHFKVIYGSSEVKEYGPKNTYLFDSLLSGLSLKYGLASTSTMHAAINDGLDARPGSDKAQVLVVGTCIQLLLHGSELVTMKGTYRKTAQTVATKLKAQEAMKTVKDPNGITLLELAILHAESGLKPENDRDDNLWAILFPSQ